MFQGFQKEAPETTLSHSQQALPGTEAVACSGLACYGQRCSGHRQPPGQLSRSQALSRSFCGGEACPCEMTVFSSTKTPPDILCLYGARALRGFGDGFAIIILPVYLAAIGFTPQAIGIVASASLLGTAALTLITGFIAPRYELRKLFLAGAGLVALTGLMFPGGGSYAPLLSVAF